MDREQAPSPWPRRIMRPMKPVAVLAATLWLLSLVLTTYARYTSSRGVPTRIALDRGVFQIAHNYSDWSLIQSHMAGSSYRPAWTWHFGTGKWLSRSIYSSPAQLTVDYAWHIPTNPSWLPQHESGGLWIIPFWIPISALSAVHAALAWWTRPTGRRCEKCQYSLEGLAPNAPCPECGTTPNS